MNKLFAIAALCVTLVGCSMNYDEVQQKVKSCEDKGGTPLLFKGSEGVVYKVRCEIDGVTYLMGDFE